MIGLTLVALGTSLPELATTVMAAMRRQADVVLGNVIGSNMFNLLAIIGITALVGPDPGGPEFLVFDLWVMLGASLCLIPFVLLASDMGRLWGIALTALYWSMSSRSTELKGRDMTRALVTGAGKRLGRAMALDLAGGP